MPAYLRRNSIAFRTTAAILLACYLPACTGWRTQSAAPEQVMTTKHPERVRITRQDGSRVELLQPAIEADSVSGRDAGASGPDSLKPRVAVALADIRTVELHQTKVAETVLLVGAAGLLIAAVIAYESEPLFSFKGNGQNSCPLVYAWNGHDWQLQSGTFAGAVARGVARTDVTAMPQAVAGDGELRLQVRNELEETDYLDAISVLAVDHPPGVTIAPDAAGRLHAVGALLPALEARDVAGRDVASQLGAPDGRSWESALQPRDTVGSALADGVELVFSRPPGVRTAQLVVDARNTSWVPFVLERTLATRSRAAGAWYDSLLTSPSAAQQYRTAVVREAGLRVLIRKGGSWAAQGVVLDPGPEITKRQVVPMDLTGVDGPAVHVRLESAPSFWMIDYVGMSYDVEPPLAVQELAPAAALTPEGRSVLPLVGAADGRAWGFEQGERAELRFPVPPLLLGMARSYLVRSTGWYTIHVPDRGDDDFAALQRVIREPGAVARLSTTALNDALRLARAPH